MTDRYLVTGAAGFVGSHLVRHLLTNTDAHLVLPLTFRHQGNADRIKVATEDHPDWQRRMTVIHHDLRAPFSLTQLHEIGHADVIFSVASRSHVDDSIADPTPFIQDNVAIATTIVDLARALQPDKVIHVSTDEVYGPAYGDRRHYEWDTLLPSNPYSASKAAQEAVMIAAWRTYGVPVIITNTMNIIGETQDKQKFVPKTLRAICRDETVVAHVDRWGRPSSRFYLHARNQADALLYVARNVDAQMYPDDTYPQRLHVVGEQELDVFQMIDLIAAAVTTVTGELHVPTIDPVNFHGSRPGHDMRYALDGSKIAALGWHAPVPLYESLERTVRWTLEHPEWLL